MKDWELIVQFQLFLWICFNGNWKLFQKELCFFCFGGNSGMRSLTTIEIYDVEENVWKNISDSPFAISQYGAVNWNEIVLIFGAFEEINENITNFVISFDSKTQEWDENFAKMPEIRYRHIAEMIENDKVVLIGGDWRRKLQNH